MKKKPKSRVDRLRLIIFNVINRGNLFPRISRCYDFVMLAMIFASIYPLMFLNQSPWFRTIDVVTTVAFIIDYVCRWSTADFLLRRGWRSFVTYPFTPMAIIDLLSILPGLRVLAPSFKLFRITRMFRIFRVMRLFRYSHKIMIFIHILEKQKQILLSVLLLAVFYIFVTAIIMFNIEPAINPKTGDPTFGSFFDALYWAATTLTTVGYGDIVPVTTAGRCVSMISALFGVAIIALPSGVITGAYLSQLKIEKEGKNGAKHESSDDSLSD